MSAKLRLTLWITLMVLVLAALLLVFLFVSNRVSAADDPAGRLVEAIARNARAVEYDRGRFEWDDLSSYRRGVYCMYYNDTGERLYGAIPDGLVSDLPFQAGSIRTVSADSGEEYYLYDSYVDMTVGGLWIRGVISTTDSSGLRVTILIIALTVLPILLLITIGGGWLIAWGSFRPIDQILRAADSISGGDDLSARLNIRRGPLEMRRLGAAFDRMFARLERSFTTEKQFASDASHEMRTPITVIMAECDRAKRKCETREDFLAALEVIDEQARHMSELTTQLLNLTRMQHGTDRYPLRRGDLSGFVEACCAEFVPADPRGIRLATDITAGVEAEFNSTLMSRVILNLLQNAYKYGRENGHVWVSLRRGKGGAVLCVRDDGIGIAPEDQDRIWQRFWQSAEARGSESGNGLGLAMVKEIAEFHNGSVSVESEPGAGSSFTVTLP